MSAKFWKLKIIKLKKWNVISQSHSFVKPDKLDTNKAKVYTRIWCIIANGITQLFENIQLHLNDDHEFDTRTASKLY